MIGIFRYYPIAPSCWIWGEVGRFKESSRRRILGPHTTYYCLDYEKRHKPHVVGDIQTLPFRDSCVDGVLCVAVLEHIPEPQRAVDEMYRILTKGGVFLGYVPFLYPYHGSPSDYHRFTQEGVEFLFRRFGSVMLDPWGDYLHVIAAFLTGCNVRILDRLSPLLQWFRKGLEAVLRLRKGKRDYARSLGRSVLGYRIYAVK